MSVEIANLAHKPENRCFREVATALESVLTRLGTDRLIVLGANDRDTIKTIKVKHKDAIFFNAEPVNGQFWFEDLRGRIVWDYSEINVERLKNLGITAIHCPIGYDQTMTWTKPWNVTQDIDVLFYGWANPRRRQVLDAIEDAGMNCMWLFGTYGSTRDQLIARSKVVLNLHFHEHSIFEIFRCSHLFANHKCVVTENSGEDPALEVLAQRATCYTARKDIADACWAMVVDEKTRRVQEERGFEEFSKTSFLDNVRFAFTHTQALEQS